MRVSRCRTGSGAFVPDWERVDSRTGLMIAVILTVLCERYTRQAGGVGRHRSDRAAVWQVSWQRVGKMFCVVDIVSAGWGDGSRCPVSGHARTVPCVPDGTLNGSAAVNFAEDLPHVGGFFRVEAGEIRV